MSPLNRELAKEGHNIRTFEVWYNARNTELLQFLDMGRCGGVPFYFNKRTRKYICGATTMDNLRRWANDRPSDMFLPPPDLIKPTVQPEDDANSEARDWLKERWRKVKAKADMKKRMPGVVEQKDKWQKVKAKADMKKRMPGVV